MRAPAVNLPSKEKPIGRTIVATLLLLCCFRLAQGEPQCGPLESLEQRGVSFGALVVLDAVAARGGGDSLGSGGLGLVEFGGSLDTQAVGFWSGGTFMTTFHGTFGRQPSAYVGDYQVTSNIEAPEELRVYETWYGHALKDGRLRLRLGVQDLNFSFNLLENGVLFVNSSFGITPEFAQVEPSIFPRTALGVLVDHRFANRGYLVAGAFNAVPGERFADQFSVRRDEGLLLAAEGGVIDAEPGIKLGAGAWHSDGKFTDFDAVPRSRNSGFYFIAERSFGTVDGLRILPFLQLGWARSDRNQLAHYRGAGVQFAGWLRQRADDRIGLGYAEAVNGDRFVATGADRRERAIELTYLAELAPWVSIQPDLQLVLHPGKDRTADDAWVGTLRFIFNPLAR